MLRQRNGGRGALVILSLAFLLVVFSNDGKHGSERVKFKRGEILMI